MTTVVYSDRLKRRVAQAEEIVMLTRRLIGPNVRPETERQIKSELAHRIDGYAFSVKEWRNDFDGDLTIPTNERGDTHEEVPVCSDGHEPGGGVDRRVASRGRRSTQAHLSAEVGGGSSAVSSSPHFTIRSAGLQMLDHWDRRTQ